MIEIPATARRRDGAVTLAWVAVGFAIAAVFGSFVSFVGYALEWLPFRLMGIAPVVTALAAMFSWALASIATIIAGIRLLRRSASRRSSKIALALAAPGSVLGTAVLVLLVIWVSGLMGVGAGNRAEDLARPVVSSYAELGAEIICDDGDGGQGLFNGSPWYSAYLEVPSAGGTEEHAEQSLRDAGFSDVRSRVPITGLGDDVAPESFAFTAGEGENTATVTVHPKGAAQLYCSRSSIEYGEEYRATDGRVLVAVQVLRPRYG